VARVSPERPMSSQVLDGRLAEAEGARVLCDERAGLGRQ
jgi:hypothetical protein